MTEHTQWHTDRTTPMHKGDKGFLVVRPTGGAINEIIAHISQDHEDKAQLIAAAPDLMAACKEVLASKRLAAIFVRAD